MTTPLATLADLKTFMGLTSNNSDAVLQTILDSSELAIGNYCNRNFTSHSMTEWRDGNGNARMQLATYPLTAVQCVTIDNQVVPPYGTNGPFGYQWALGGRALWLAGCNYRFTRGMRNVQVVCTGGYGDASGPGGTDVMPWPSDLKLALLEYATTRFKERDRLGVGSKTLAGESITFDSGSGTSASSMGIPAAARVILDNYLNTIPETGQ